MEYFDEIQVRKTIATLIRDGELFEVRIVKGRSTVSGYFTDADTLIKQLGKQNLQGANVYIVPNAIHKACYAREQKDCFLGKDVAATTDADITGREWILVDIDPARPAKTSATVDEITYSYNKALSVRRFLREQGFEWPILATSGNGMHLLYKIEMQCSLENKDLLKRWLESLSELFSDEQAKIDVVNYNESRGCKLYGTMAQKGLDDAVRKHRMSKIVEIPEQIMSTGRAYFEKVAGIIDHEKMAPSKYNGYGMTFDLEEWMGKYGICYRKYDGQGYTKYVLDCCPFNESHKAPDSMITKTASGAIGFKCLHNSCAERKWKDVRLLYEPDAYTKKWEEEERRTFKDYNRNRTIEPTIPKDEDMGITVKEIISRPRQAQTFIKTGIDEFDRSQRGMKKKGIFLLSGYTGGAKSTLLSQIMLNAINDGYHVSCFSGEFADDDFADWIIQQAAGKANVEPGKYDGYYNVPIATKELIADWIAKNLIIYKNHFGFAYSSIMEFCRREVEDRATDLICLDNLMAFNISELSDNELRAQTDFIWRLHEFAMNNNVAVVLVAHPKKTGGLLNWQDISGSSNIVNAIDTLAYIYRVDQSFRNYYAEFYNIPRMRGKGEDESPVDAMLREKIGDATNVMAIKKARFGRVTDEFTPLWFEKESLRLKNSKAENKHYGWETERMDGFISADVDEEVPFS